jgi:hypothetical protein
MILLVRLRVPLLFAVLSVLAACTGHRPPADPFEAGWTAADRRDLSAPKFDPDVQTVCNPPIHWQPQPLKSTSAHIHQIWLSPTGATAYGIIYFKLPLPVGANLALSGFLSQMKQTEGDATLLDEKSDPQLPGIRFTARGGLYTIHANLIVRGWEGWTVYAGTERDKPIRQDELDIAVRAREHTLVGRPENSGN